MSQPAFIRLIANQSRASHGLYNLHLSCYVKPNVVANRAGVTKVGTDRVDISVAVAPRDNAANAAVSQIIAEALQVPKSSVGVIRGVKAREKTLCITDVNIGKHGAEDDYIKDTIKRLIDVVRKPTSK